MRYANTILVFVYLASAVLANLIIAKYGTPAVIPVCLVFIGFDLTARDSLHESWHGRGLWWKMLLLICAGSIISYLINQEAARVAIASAAAFMAAGLADTVIYWVLGEKSRLVKINGSNAVSAVVDSIMFIGIAFGLDWKVIVAQILAKIIGGAIWGYILTRYKGKGTGRKVPVNMHAEATG